jgi:succinyl-diaminopimelate desuccinylase
MSGPAPRSRSTNCCAIDVSDFTDPVALAQALIRRPSVTPKDEGAIDLLIEALSSLGFACHDLSFSAPDTPDVRNLYARLGSEGPNFCFAGHTDVVPVGQGWTRDPFAAAIENGVLYGRGACDMKGGIAAFIAAIARRLKENGPPKGSISLLITGDEEGPAINGTVKVLDWLAERGEKIDFCLVGEPTNPTELGQEIKIGRRGSLNGRISLKGSQGHTAYPQLADNPIPRLLQKLNRLIAEPLDQGSEHFEPSNVEITTIDVGNPATNVIPAEIRAGFNIRFNDLHSGKSLNEKLMSIFGQDLRIEVSGESFLTPPGQLSRAVAEAIEAETGRIPAFTTTGGTSDARFIKSVSPVVEFGLVNKTIHKADECVAIADLESLSRIYRLVIDKLVGGA